MVMQNAVLDLKGPLSLAAEKKGMALMDRAATSRTLSQELKLFSRQQVSARIFRRRLQQHEPSARRPWLRLSLTLHHRQERLQWSDKRRTWCTIGDTSFFQINPGPVNSIKMVASVFAGIVVNTHLQRASAIITLAHNLQ
ncbi:hypothetical protein TNCV_1547321 [Trichonephila clavipes]|nr:hypothetical protein TNCV_1547321 [Trichonephila clavipes]